DAQVAIFSDLNAFEEIVGTICIQTTDPGRLPSDVEATIDKAVQETLDRAEGTIGPTSSQMALPPTVWPSPTMPITGATAVWKLGYSQKSCGEKQIAGVGVNGEEEDFKDNGDEEDGEEEDEGDDEEEEERQDIGICHPDGSRSGGPPRHEDSSSIVVACKSALGRASSVGRSVRKISLPSPGQSTGLSGHRDVVARPSVGHSQFRQRRTSTGLGMALSGGTLTKKAAARTEMSNMTP
ncbi:unnamed protein product, partial [Protopolystoma xenopodis]